MADGVRSVASQVLPEPRGSVFAEERLEGRGLSGRDRLRRQRVRGLRRRLRGWALEQPLEFLPLGSRPSREFPHFAIRELLRGCARRMEGDARCKDRSVISPNSHATSPPTKDELKGCSESGGQPSPSARTP